MSTSNLPLGSYAGAAVSAALGHSAAPETLIMPALAIILTIEFYRNTKFYLGHGRPHQTIW
jgi:hypothetical protein